jgi:hypothetical protein
MDVAWFVVVFDSLVLYLGDILLFEASPAKHWRHASATH